jgi:polyketide cyclase/dehydrase/lipid transport protein
MPVEVRPEIVVRRDRADVAAYMFNPEHDMEWTGGITASRPSQPGPLREGAHVERTARFVGRGFTYRYVVTGHEPDRMVELTVDRPFPMTIRYELADHPDGTLVAIHAVGTPGRFFGWASPILTRQVRASIAADLRRLRDRLERLAR